LDVVRGQGRYGFVGLPFFLSSIFCAAWIFNQTTLLSGVFSVALNAGACVRSSLLSAIATTRSPSLPTM
jgi:hypothetical protein